MRARTPRPTPCSRYNRGYTQGMKTAISLPDEVFAAAERYAKQHGLSRSELYARALRRFLEDEQATAIRASYDAAFGDDETSDDLRAARNKAARDALGKIEW